MQKPLNNAKLLLVKTNVPCEGEVPTQVLGCCVLELCESASLRVCESVCSVGLSESQLVFHNLKRIVTGRTWTFRYILLNYIGENV